MVLELDRSKLWDVFLFLRIKITVRKIWGMGRRTTRGAITAYKNDIAGLNETAGEYNVSKVTWKRRSDDKKDIRVMAKMEFEKQKNLASVETVAAATFQKRNRLWYRIVRANRRMKRMKIAFVLFGCLHHWNQLWQKCGFVVRNGSTSAVLTTIDYFFKRISVFRVISYLS